VSRPCPQQIRTSGFPTARRQSPKGWLAGRGLTWPLPLRVDAGRLGRSASWTWPSTRLPGVAERDPFNCARHDRTNCRDREPAIREGTQSRAPDRCELPVLPRLGIQSERARLVRLGAVVPGPTCSPTLPSAANEPMESLSCARRPRWPCALQADHSGMRAVNHYAGHHSRHPCQPRDASVRCNRQGPGSPEQGPREPEQQRGLLPPPHVPHPPHRRGTPAQSAEPPRARAAPPGRPGPEMPTPEQRSVARFPRDWWLHGSPATTS
jgi:hypothetical protein